MSAQFIKGSAASLFGQQSLVVLITDGSGNFPHSVVIVPDRHELRIPNIVWLAWMMKTVNPDFHCSVTLQRIDFQRIYQKRALYLAADVLLNRGKKWSFSHHQSGHVVVELKIVRHH